VCGAEVGEKNGVTIRQSNEQTDNTHIINIPVPYKDLDIPALLCEWLGGEGGEERGERGPTTNHTGSKRGEHIATSWPAGDRKQKI